MCVKGGNAVIRFSVIDMPSLICFCLFGIFFGLFLFVCFVLLC